MDTIHERFFFTQFMVLDTFSNLYIVMIKKHLVLMDLEETDNTIYRRYIFKLTMAKKWLNKKWLASLHA